MHLNFLQQLAADVIAYALIAGGMIVFVIACASVVAGLARLLPR